MRRWIARLAACALPCATWFAATAAPGDWDRSFAQAGRLPFTLPGITFSVRDWAQQPDGKVVVVGHTTGVNSIENNDCLVARFNADGSPDSSFDGDGYRQFDFGSTVIGLVELERQADGKLLIAGQAGPGSGDVHLLRLTTGGTPDPAYGLGGEVTIALASNTAYANPALKLAANGDAIVVSGYFLNAPGSFGSIAVTRVTAAGVIDSSFGTSGTAYIQSTHNVFATYLDVAADGKIVVAGERGPYGNQVPIVARLTSTGQPDASFGTGGLVVLPFLTGDGFSSAIAATSTGQVVFTGERHDGNGSEVWYLARLTSTGTPDPAFGSAGRIVLEHGGAKSLVIESDGKIVVAGFGGTNLVNPALSRYNSDGSPDVSFGLRGTRLTDFSTGSVAVGGELSRLQRNADGTYTALVTTNDGTANSYALARFVAQGSSPGVIGIRSEFESPALGGPTLLYESTPTVRMSVYRTGGSDGTVSVQYRTVSGTAIAGQDFVAKTGTVTFNDGETEASFDIQIIDDSIQEPNFNERFEVELFAPTGGAGLSKQRAVIEILPDSDWGQRVALYGGSFIESATARFLLNRSGDMSGPLTINYTVTPGSATAGSDYTGTSGSVQWASNQGGFKEFTVPLVNDAVAESGEDFTVTITDPNGVAASMFVTASIVDDDNAAAAQTVAFGANSIYVNENAGTATLTVYRLGNPALALSVPWSLAVGSGSSAAGENVDFVPSSGTLNWNAGESGSKTISVPLVNDSIYEPLETFSATLDAPVGVTIAGPPFATIFIKDDDGTPSQPVISIGPDMIVNESAGTISIPVTLTGTPDAYVSVDFNGTHETTTPNDLVIPASGLAWAPGESGTRMIDVPIFNDPLDEIDETFSMYISRPSVGASLGRTQMRVTIVDNDPTPAGQPAPVAPGVQVTSSNVTVSEGQRTVNVDVKRVGDPGDYLTVFFGTVDGTATSPTDYLVAGSQLGWMPNDTTARHVELQINGDSVAEPTETFTLNFVTFTMGPTGPTVSVPITITDDDAPAPPARVGLTSATQSVAESATSVTLQVGRSGNTSGASSVDFATTAGTAGAADFTASSGTLTWAANDASLKSITIPLSPDTIDEPDETFTLTLKNPSSGTELDTATATITIQDDDLPPPPLPARVSVAATAQSVPEGAAAATIEVTRTGNTSVASTVDYTTTVGTAGSADFTATSGTLTWAANDTATKSVTIALLPDVIDEPDETFTLTLGNPSSGTQIDSATTTVTILDDDLPPPLPARVGLVNATQSVSESLTSVTIHVGRTGNTSGVSTVDYATAVGTAGSADFTASTGTLTWAANDTATKPVIVTLLPDAIDEPDETFTLTLSNPSSGTQLDTAATTITIQDDDAAPPPNNGGGSSSGSGSGGGGGGGGGSESLLSLLALASLLVARRRRAT